MSWRIFTHHTLKTLLRAAQLFFLVVLPAMLLWLYFAGLPGTFHSSVVEAARRAGLDLQFERMRLSPLEGLVLDKVRLRSEKLPDNPEVAIDRAALSLDWRKLPRGQVELTALDLRGAQLFLPVASAEGVTRTLRLTKARARLMLADGVVSVPLARFNLQGIDVIASGQIMLAASSGEASPLRLPPEAARALEVVESADFGTTPPTLELEFSAKSGDAGAMQLPRIRFEAAQASYRAVRLRDVLVNASFVDDVLAVQRFAARDDRRGRFDAAGYWNAKTGQAQADWSSTLDPAPWLDELKPGGPWRDLSFASPLSLQGNMAIEPGQTQSVQIVGAASAGKFSFRGVAFDGLSAGFAWRRGELYVSDARLALDDGKIQADFMSRQGDVRLRVDCRADPSALATLLGERDRANLAKMELAFIDAPRIIFEARGDKLHPANLRATGKMQLGRTSIHGSPMESASADLAFEGLALTLKDINVKRPEGTGSGSFTYDFGRKQVRLDGIRSTMNPFNVLQWADPKVAVETKPYRFKAPPEVTVGGVIGLDDATQTRLWADFTAPRGLDYDLLDRTLSFGAAKGSLEFTGRQIRVDVPSARLYGGSVKIAADITTGEPGVPQKMNIELDAVNFEALTRLYFDYKDSQGVVSGRYNFTFVGGKPELMRGSGNLLVENGNVFAIPVLGPLSAILSSIVPGTGYQTARKATCDFRVANGEIRTDNLDVTGQGFSMIGQGSLFFLRDTMDFAVRINAQGVPGVLLYPVSKLLEYVSDGKLSEPQWRPRALPKLPGKRDEREKTPKEGSAAPPSEEARRNGRA